MIHEFSRNTTEHLMDQFQGPGMFQGHHRGRLTNQTTEAYIS